MEKFKDARISAMETEINRLKQIIMKNNAFENEIFDYYRELQSKIEECIRILNENGYTVLKNGRRYE